MKPGMQAGARKIQDPTGGNMLDITALTYHLKGVLIEPVSQTLVRVESAPEMLRSFRFFRENIRGAVARRDNPIREWVFVGTDHD